MKEFSIHSYSQMQVSLVNEKAKEDQRAFFRECEENYQKQVETAASLCQGEKQMILLAGPSASGKTTTAHKIAKTIIAQGRKAEVVSLDDFYRNRAEIPLCEDGKPDLESVYALDLKVMEKCFRELLETGEAMIPQYDFHVSRRAEEWRKVYCSPGQILVVEGIHGLNPEVLKTLDDQKVIKMYVSARTKYMDGSENALIPKQLRLIRRMVRDYKFRNTAPQITISLWENVCSGERNYINPYRDGADYKIDSAMDYEPGVYRSILQPFLEESLKNERVNGRDFQGVEKLPEQDEILDRLMRDLARFAPLPETLIPEDSVVREFLG